MNLLSRFVGFLRGDPPPSAERQGEARPAPDSAAAPADDLPPDIDVGRWLNIWERSWPDVEAARGYCVEQVAFARDDAGIYAALMGNHDGHPALRGKGGDSAEVNGAGMTLLPGLLAQFEHAPETVSLIRMIADSENMIHRWLEEAAAEHRGWEPIAAKVALAREDSAAQTLFVLAGQRDENGVSLRLASHASADIPPQFYSASSSHWVDAGTARFWPRGFDAQRRGWTGFLARQIEDPSVTYLLGRLYERKDVPPSWPWALDDSAEEIEFARREWLDVELNRGLDGDELSTHVLMRSGNRCTVRAVHYWRIRSASGPSAYQLHSANMLACISTGEDLVELLTAIRAAQPRRAACARIPLADWEPLCEVAPVDDPTPGYLTDGLVTTLAMVVRSVDGSWQPRPGTARCMVSADRISLTSTSDWIPDLLARDDVISALAAA